MGDRRTEQEIIEVVETAPGSGVFGAGVQVYVSGEGVPQGPATGSGCERALVAARQVSDEEILARFAEWMRLDVADGQGSEATMKSYLGDLRQHLGWLAEAGITPTQAGEDDLKEYRAWLVDEYAASTAGRKLVSVRRFYQMAQARGMLAENPAAGLRSPKDRTARHEKVKFLPVHVLQRLLDTPHPEKPKGIRDRAILRLMVHHGLRVVEVRRLDLEGVDWEAGEEGSLQVFGKRGKWRTIYLTPKTRVALEKWLAVRDLMKLNSPAVFVSMHWARDPERAGPGGRLTTRGIRGMVDKYLAAIGAKKPGVSCHAMRHSHGTWAYFQSGDLLALSREMGHESVTTTQVYASVVSMIKSNPAKYLDEMFG